MSAREAHVELLLGTMVHDPDGRRLGRIEEIHAMEHGGRLLVSEFLVGRYGVAARLTSASFVPRLVHLLGIFQRRRGYVIPWTWMDLSDPAHPRATRPRHLLREIRDDDVTYKPAT